MEKSKTKEKTDACQMAYDLEIISIGTLYSGPWEKKYWSGSRGKDRHPYPVGYHAHRNYNGSNFKMEVHVGPIGPLFEVSTNEVSCSGCTPHIALEKLWKKGFMCLKMWDGKRFSSKIDGIEFFGFNNSFVKRLLRELVIDVSGKADRFLLSTKDCESALVVANSPLEQKPLCLDSETGLLISHGSAADSHPQGETNRYDCDLAPAGNEAAKSMMEVLLPQAIPLFRTSNSSCDGDVSIDNRDLVSGPKSAAVCTSSIHGGARLPRLFAKVYTRKRLRNPCFTKCKDGSIFQIGHVEGNGNSRSHGVAELVGCYLHPFPVSSLSLCTRGREIFICVLSGHPVGHQRTLLMYKLAAGESGVGCPSFAGYTHITLPSSSSTDVLGREASFERCVLQVARDGLDLILLGCVKVPYCRERKVDCLCSACASERSECCTVRIVQIKSGYVSVILRLTTFESVHCLLVCERNRIVGAGASGRLHMWIMNSIWSASTEECSISGNCMVSCIVELKKIPNCSFLIVGHDGYGDFTIWDVSKRILVVKFSAPGASVYQFLPINVSIFPKELNKSNCSDVEEHVIKTPQAADLFFSDKSKNDFCHTQMGDDVEIWFFITTISTFDSQQVHTLGGAPKHNNYLWRFGVLMKNTLVLGNPLDARATSIASSIDVGLIGTNDGIVYMWELLTGRKLGILHHFKGGSVECIATDDDSRSRTFAVASSAGQLFVYKIKP